MNSRRDVFIYQIYRLLLIHLKHFFVLLIFLCILLLLQSRSSIPKQTYAKAFIISSNCPSPQFLYAKANLQRAFPHFFMIYCFQSIPLTDSRIDPQLSTGEKAVASDALSFTTLLIDQIANSARLDQYQWSFIFQDHVNFVSPTKFALDNYLDTVQELMHDFDIRIDDGVLYLGIHQPEFYAQHYGLVSSSSNSSLFSSKAFGRGTYAIALTKKFVSEMLSSAPKK